MTRCKGTHVPSLYNLHALRTASSAMKASVILIADALGNNTLSEQVSVILQQWLIAGVLMQAHCLMCLPSLACV